MIKYFCDVCGKELSWEDAIECKMPRYIRPTDMWIIKKDEYVHLCDECIDMLARLGMEEVIE